MAKTIYSVVIGSVNGRLTEVFSKLASLHAKQNFAFAIVAGDLFADINASSSVDQEEIKKILNGSIEVPLPTYFSIGSRALPAQVSEKLNAQNGELCSNLVCLSRKLSIKTSEGFKIVAIGGLHSDSTDVTPDPYDAVFSDLDALALSKEFDDADVLITSTWPAAVCDGSRISYNGENPRGIQSISDLCTALTPRYHFSTSPVFYEREPFFHLGSEPRQITRFLSLAPFGNTGKHKWIYAFNLEPSAAPPLSLPAGSTASPFTNPKKRKTAFENEVSQNFRYSNGQNNHQDQSHFRRNKRSKNQPMPRPSECFFCLSNAACETHMITSIGTDCYVAVAKGPLSTTSTFPGLGFSAHMLLIPLHHVPTLAAVSEDDARQNTINEMQQYRAAMHEMLKAKAADETAYSRLGAVTWEISRNRGVHAHWQFLPVPVDLVQRGLVEAAFDVEAERLGYPKFVKSVTDLEKAEEGEFFKVMVWSESLRKDMVLPLNDSFRFDLQFARKVLAKLLGKEERVDWRSCAQNKAEEEADVVRFKEAFRQFDFSLEDS